MYRTKILVIDSVKRDKPSFNLREVQGLYASLYQTCQNTVTYIPCQSQPTCYCPATCTLSSPSCYYYIIIMVLDAWDEFVAVMRILRMLMQQLIGLVLLKRHVAPIYMWESLQTIGTLFIFPVNRGFINRLMVYDLRLCNYKVHFFG